MEEELISQIYQLKNALNSDKRVKDLEEAEKEMNNSVEVALLAQKKEEAADDYNFALSHFKKDSEEVIKAQKALYKAKLALDEHLLVANYTKKYIVVRDLYNEINDILFSIINKDKCTGGCKKWE